VFERGSAVDTLNNARPIAANNFLSKDAKWSAPISNTLGVASLCVTCKNSVWSSCQMKGQLKVSKKQASGMLCTCWMFRS
jgi:hypothetical protein